MHASRAARASSSLSYHRRGCYTHTYVRWLIINGAAVRSKLLYADSRVQFARDTNARSFGAPYEHEFTSTRGVYTAVALSSCAQRELTRSGKVDG